jgi:hypothetical protein
MSFYDDASKKVHDTKMKLLSAKQELGKAFA